MAAPGHGWFGFPEQAAPLDPGLAQWASSSTVCAVGITCHRISTFIWLRIHSVLKCLSSTCYKPGSVGVRDGGMSQTDKIFALFELNF